MPRSKIYGGGGLAGQFLRDTVFSDQIGPGKYQNRGLQDKSAPPPGPDTEIPTFFASLVTNTDAQTYGDSVLAATEVRASHASLIQRGEVLIAFNDDIRQERLNRDGTNPLGTLMEPPGTNKCTNFKANPDAALTGMSIIGSGSLSRVQDPAVLEASGLAKTCTSGYVFKLENTDAGNVTVYIDGVTGNTNPHSCSIYARKDSSSQNATFLELEGTQSIEFTNTDTYQKIALSAIPANSSSRLGVTAEPNSVAYFVLNQLEQSGVVSSVIATDGAAGTRAVDQLSWPVTDSQGRDIINQTEGMLAVFWRPAFDSSDGQNANRSYRIISTDSDILYYYQASAFQLTFRSNSQGTDAVVAIVGDSFNKEDLFVVMLRWAGGNHQVGYKVGGNVTWGTQAIYSGFSVGENIALGDLTKGNDIPFGAHYRNVNFWDVDKGTTWLENFFSEVAN